MSKKVKIFAIVVISIALLIWIFSLTGGEDSTSAPISTTNNSLSNNIGGQTPIGSNNSTSMSDGNEFALLLANIKSITIDNSIFSNPAYKALRDHPIDVGIDIVGRNNPFAPVGTDGANLSDAPSVQTLQPGKVTSVSAEFSAQVTFTTTAPVSVVFQYGTTNQFGNVTSPQVLKKSGTVLETVTGLSPNTVYYVQAVAVVGSTTTNGSVMTFTTTTPPGTR